MALLVLAICLTLAAVSAFILVIDDQASIAWLFLGIVSSCVGVGAVGAMLDEKSCQARWASSFQPRHTFVTGCMIKPPGSDIHIPASSYRFSESPLEK
jgi:uncharacterized membrane protein HdeD (DUF308 family)